MMITDRPADMSLRGLGRIPAHWKGFTAIIECLSEGEPSLLRDSESPQHNRISTDYITDEERRKEAANRLAELGQWCRDRIEEQVAPQTANEDNVGELAKHLPIDDEGAARNNGQSASGRSARPVISIAPREQNSPPRDRPRPPVRGARDQTHEQGQGNTDDTSDRERELRRRTRHNPRPRPPVNTPVTFARPRFRQGARGGRTHSVVVSFDNPKAPLPNVQLAAVGEDGQEVTLGIREAHMDGQPLPVSDDKIQLDKQDDAERLAIEFTTREPVANKTFYIKCGPTEDPPEKDAAE